MAEYKLALKKRELVGKKTRLLRKEGLIPSVVFGGKEPILLESEYVQTEKALQGAGYHSPIDLDMDGKKQMAIVKDIHIDPVTRRIVNVEFQAVSANKTVEASTPIVLINFDDSEAAKVYHFVLSQVMEEIEVKAKPADLPKNIEVDASGLKNTEDKITVSDIKLPEGVELVDKELDPEQLVASVYDPAAEAAAREAKEKAAAEAAAAAEEAEGEAKSADEEAGDGDKAETEKTEE